MYNWTHAKLGSVRKSPIPTVLEEHAGWLVLGGDLCIKAEWIWHHPSGGNVRKSPVVKHCGPEGAVGGSAFSLELAVVSCEPSCKMSGKVSTTASVVSASCDVCGSRAMTASTNSNQFWNQDVAGESKGSLYMILDAGTQRRLSKTKTTQRLRYTKMKRHPLGR